MLLRHARKRDICAEILTPRSLSSLRDLVTGLCTSLLLSLNGRECTGELGLAPLPDSDVPELPLTPGCDANLRQCR